MRAPGEKADRAHVRVPSRRHARGVPLSGHGILVLDKEAGVSSAKALNAVKREYEGKVGHAGTLDPFATGVLLALVGDATRLSDLAMALPKTYEARVRFGWRTDTLDPEGEVVDECDPGEERPLPLDRFVGDIEQMPPAFSALKVKGRRAYELARRGEAPELKARTVTVYACEGETDWPHANLRIRCGAGTYIRAIARDLGEAVGLPASLVALRRTAIGPYAAEQAGTLFPPLSLVEAAGLPAVEVGRDEARRFVSGQAIAYEGQGHAAAVHGDRLLGLGDAARGKLHPFRVLAGARRAFGGRA